MTLKFNEQVYIFEFKVVELAPEGKALQQIKDKDYADTYQALNQAIHLLGVEFSLVRKLVILLGLKLRLSLTLNTSKTSELEPLLASFVQSNLLQHTAYPALLETHIRHLFFPETKPSVCSTVLYLSF